MCCALGPAAQRGVASPTRAVPCPSGAPANADCRVLRLPERPEAPAGRQIDVLVVRVPSRSASPAADAALVIVGGPGQAASAMLPLLVNRFAGVLASRDLVVVDQRGTGGSNRLACASGAAADPARLLGPAFTAQEVAACARALDARADLGAYTTTNAAHDLEQVRLALGIPQWTLMGGSYGTKVAMEYARRFPQGTRALVLEGVAGPEYPNPLPHARAGQAALDSLLAACRADVSCNSAYPNLAVRTDSLLARLEQAPVSVPVPGRPGPPVTLGRDEVAYGLHLLLFSNATSPAIPLLLTRASEGDYWPVANVLAQVTAGLAAQIDLGMQLSVTCMEDAPMYDSLDVVREGAGTYLRGLMAASTREECARWPVRPMTPLPVVPLDAPALLLSGAFDPATPRRFADAVAARMPRAVHLLVPYGAHVTIDRCVDGIIAAYVASLLVSDDEQRCLSLGRRPPFVIQGR